MALESLPKIAPALFSAEQDLIQIYNKKSDTTGVINPSYIKSSPSGVAGAIQFSDGSAFVSDASNLFWDNTNKRLGIGTNAPTRTTTIQGILGLNDSTGAEQMYILPSTTGVDMRAGNAFRFDVRTGVGTTTSYLVTSLFGIGTNSPTAKTHIVGSGSTSATTSLLVQNSGGSAALQIRDDRSIDIIANELGNIGWGQSIKFFGPTGEFRTTFGGGGGFFGTWYNAGSEQMRLSASHNLLLGTSTDIASSKLTIDSTTKGFLPPRMTDAQVRAIATPAVGLMAFNTDLDCPVFYSAAGWRKVSHSVM